MNTFVRAIITGFGFSLGSALYKRVSGKLGLEDADKDADKTAKAEASDSEPGDGEIDAPEPNNA